MSIAKFLMELFFILLLGGVAVFCWNLVRQFYLESRSDKGDSFPVIWIVFSVPSFCGLLATMAFATSLFAVFAKF